MTNEVMIAAVVAVLIAVVFMRLRAGLREGNGLSRGNPARPPKVVTASRDAINDPSVQAAIQRDNKIEAIKYYRELTGLGLKESKDVIDAVMAGRSVMWSEDAPDVPSVSLSTDGSPAGDKGIRDLIRRGKKIEAIKAYRDFTGAGLAEAKAAVEAIERGMRQGSTPE